MRSNEEMPQRESDYWDSEISDAELDALADAGDQLPIPAKPRKKSAAEKAASKRREQMASAVERGDREAFNRLVKDPQRQRGELETAQNTLVELASNLIVCGDKATARKVERAISKLQDVLDVFEEAQRQLH